MKFRFILIYMAVHLFGLELFSWGLNFISCKKEPALFHPQLIWDLVITAFFYFGLCIGWLILFYKHHFRIREMFLLQGLLGILLEQFGGVIDMIIKSPLQGIIVALYVFSVYGLAAGISGFLYVKAGGTLGVARSPFLQWRKYLVFPVVLILSMVVMMALFGEISSVLSFNPGKFPICERPLL